MADFTALESQVEKRRLNEKKSAHLGNKDYLVRALALLLIMGAGFFLYFYGATALLQRLIDNWLEPFKQEGEAISYKDGCNDDNLTSEDICTTKDCITTADGSQTCIPTLKKLENKTFLYLTIIASYISISYVFYEKLSKWAGRRIKNKTNVPHFQHSHETYPELNRLLDELEETGSIKIADKIIDLVKNAIDGALAKYSGPHYISDEGRHGLEIIAELLWGIISRNVDDSGEMMAEIGHYLRNELTSSYRTFSSQEITQQLVAPLLFRPDSQEHTDYHLDQRHNALRAFFCAFLNSNLPVAASDPGMCHDEKTAQCQEIIKSYFYNNSRVWNSSFPNCFPMQSDFKIKHCLALIRLVVDPEIEHQGLYDLWARERKKPDNSKKTIMPIAPEIIEKNDKILGRSTKDIKEGERFGENDKTAEQFKVIFFNYFFEKLTPNEQRNFVKQYLRKPIEDTVGEYTLGDALLYQGFCKGIDSDLIVQNILHAQQSLDHLLSLLANPDEEEPHLIELSELDPLVPAAAQNQGENEEGEEEGDAIAEKDEEKDPVELLTPEEKFAGKDIIENKDVPFDTLRNYLINFEAQHGDNQNNSTNLPKINKTTANIKSFKNDSNLTFVNPELTQVAPQLKEQISIAIENCEQGRRYFLYQMGTLEKPHYGLIILENNLQPDNLTKHKAAPTFRFIDPTIFSVGELDPAIQQQYTNIKEMIRRVGVIKIGRTKGIPIIREMGAKVWSKNWAADLGPNRNALIIMATAMYFMNFDFSKTVTDEDVEVKLENALSQFFKFDPNKIKENIFDKLNPWGDHDFKIPENVFTKLKKKPHEANQSIAEQNDTADAFLQAPPEKNNKTSIRKNIDRTSRLIPNIKDGTDVVLLLQRVFSYLDTSKVSKKELDKLFDEVKQTHILDFTSHFFREENCHKENKDLVARAIIRRLATLYNEAHNAIEKQTILSTIWYCLPNINRKIKNAKKRQRSIWNINGHLTRAGLKDNDIKQLNAALVKHFAYLLQQPEINNAEDKNKRPFAALEPKEPLFSFLQYAVRKKKRLVKPYVEGLLVLLKGKATMSIFLSDDNDAKRLTVCVSLLHTVSKWKDESSWNLPYLFSEQKPDYLKMIADLISWHPGKDNKEDLFNQMENLRNPANGAYYKVKDKDHNELINALTPNNPRIKIV